MDRPNSTSEMKNEQSPAEPDTSSGSESAQTQREELQQTSISQENSSPATPSELEQIRSERNALLERLARTQAEFDNARKRLNKEQQEFRNFALAEALRSILPIMDSLDWAIQAPVESLEEFRSGVDLIRKQLTDSLRVLGLVPIAAKGEAFDPKLHQAIEMVETDTVPDNQILAELQRGYKLHDRLLRPAAVLVTRNPSSSNRAA